MGANAVGKAVHETKNIRGPGLFIDQFIGAEFVDVALDASMPPEKPDRVLGIARNG